MPFIKNPLLYLSDLVVEHSLNFVALSFSPSITEKDLHPLHQVVLPIFFTSKGHLYPYIGSGPALLAGSMLAVFCFSSLI
jgi:hypothetical protein